MTRRHPLALALAASLACPVVAVAQDLHTHDRPPELEEVEVTASPLRGAVDTLARPVEVLSGAELDERKAATLGDTLSRETGVQSAGFGVGVGRPIIRGQEGARVQVLNGGTSSMDASTVSADHAVAIEPFLADQIEVLKGPATLLYGSGAIGGAVNVVDGRVPTAPVGAELKGRAELRHGTGAGESTGMARIDGDAGGLTWHADAFRRHVGDTRIPGFAFAPHLLAEALEDGEDPAHLARGRLPNSALDTAGGALGATWFGERAWFGLAASTYRTDYGIPPGAHHHEEGEAPDEEEEEEPPVRVDLRQHRIDARGGIRDIGPLREVGLRLAHTGYRHFELEGGAIGTRFDNHALEGRLEAVLKPVGAWRGAFGLQYGSRDFSAIGAEAFVPGSTTRDVGVFALGEGELGDVKLELGARHDRVRVAPDGGGAESRDATSLSAAVLWRASDALHLSLGIDRAQRAPTAEELFSDGAHVATQSFERGDAGLAAETARNVELGVHVHAGRLAGKASAYRVRFADYIFLADTGTEVDGLPLRTWTQADAVFTGWEAEATLTLREHDTGRTALRVFTDRVHARLDGGARLPRLAPARVGADLAWESGGWRARVGALRVSRQDAVAAFESPTPGYTLVDAHLAYHWDTAGAGWEAFLDATNLTDREARAHTSYLKDLAPLAGRNVNVGVRVTF